jgi:hypothetical protein
MAELAINPWDHVLDATQTAGRLNAFAVVPARSARLTAHRAPAHQLDAFADRRDGPTCSPPRARDLVSASTIE